MGNSLAMVQLDAGIIGIRGRPVTTYLDYINRILDVGLPLLESEIKQLCRERLRGF